MTRRRLRVWGYEVYRSKQDGHVELSLLGPTGETMNRARWTMNQTRAFAFSRGSDVVCDGNYLETSHALHSITVGREVGGLEIREQYVLEPEDLLALMSDMATAASESEG